MSKITYWYWLGCLLLAALALLPFGLGDFGGVNGGQAELMASLRWILGISIFGWAFVRISAGLGGPRAMGLSRHRGWLRNLLIGMGYGLFWILVAIGAKVALGEYRLTSLPLQQSLTAGLLVLVATAFISLSEELVFRGYLVRLLDGQSRVRIAIVSALGFTALHLPHFGAPPQYWLSLFAKGLFYVIPVLATRSLWFGVGHHWLWNWVYFLHFGGVTGVLASKMASYNPLSDYVYLAVSTLMALSTPLVNRLLLRQGAPTTHSIAS